MKIPYVANMPNKNKPEINSFGGLNLTDSAKIGELRSCMNMTSDEAPFLATRPPRTIGSTYNDPTALFDWDALVVVDGTDLYFDGDKIGTVASGEKQFAVVNTKLCIWPDKIYIDLTNHECVQMDAEASSEDGAVFTANSLSMGVTVVGGGNDAIRWLLTNDEPAIVVYSALEWTEAGWVKTGTEVKYVSDIEVGDLIIPMKVEASGAYVIKTGTPDDNEDGVYFKVTAESYAPYDWNDPELGVMHFGAENVYFDKYTLDPDSVFPGTFKAGDIVLISGCEDYPENNYSAPAADDPDAVQTVIASVTADTLTFSENLFTAGTETGTVAVRRYIPDFDYICAKDNRLWGVFGQSIYASALGDPTTFFDFSGLSTDSYVVPVGTKGDFTGIFSYGDAVLCWKDDILHRILGNLPAEYYLHTDIIFGLQAGCQKSQRVIDNVLYYKARIGICAYAGNTPSLISYKLGLNDHDTAVAGVLGAKYYVSMRDSAGVYGLYVYDTIRAVWHKEDALQAADFATNGGTMYIVDAANSLVLEAGSDGDETDIEWVAELVEFTESTLNKKKYSKLYIRADLEDDAFLKVETAVDGGDYSQAYIYHDEAKRTVTVPLRPVRCDQFCVRLSGTGRCVIKAIKREFSAGSEL